MDSSPFANVPIILIIAGLIFIFVSKIKINGKWRIEPVENNDKSVFNIGIILLVLGFLSYVVMPIPSPPIPTPTQPPTSAPIPVATLIASSVNASEKIETVNANAVNLSGVWNCDGSWGQYYLTQQDNTLWWYGESSPNNPFWSNVARGTIKDNLINMEWADVPKGNMHNSGILVLKIDSDKQFHVISRTGGWGGSMCTR